MDGSPTIFQIPLTADAHSGLREQQLETCHLVQYFEFCAKSTEKNQILDLYVLIFALCLYIYCTGVFFFFHGTSEPWKKKLLSCYRRSTTGLREGTGVPFIELCILLQIATIIQTLHAVSQTLIILCLCLRPMLQLCATSTELQVKFLLSNTPTEELISSFYCMEDGSLKVRTELLKPFESVMLV